MATVVSSVPEASSAASITSRLGAPPVPMISREPKLRPAMTSGSAGTGCETVPVLATRPVASATLHRGEDLDPGAVAQPVSACRRAARRAVDGDGDAARRRLVRRRPSTSSSRTGGASSRRSPFTEMIIESAHRPGLC